MKAQTFAELLRKLVKRKQNYQQAFAVGAPAHDALTDLAHFCRAFGYEAVPGDHDRTMILVGRREAFWRIMEHLHLEPEQLIQLYKSNVKGDEE